MSKPEKRCCEKDENIGSYRTANRTGWADFCKKCGRAWAVNAPTNPPLSGPEADQ